MSGDRAAPNPPPDHPRPRVAPQAPGPGGRDPPARRPPRPRPPRPPRLPLPSRRSPRRIERPRLHESPGPRPPTRAVPRPPWVAWYRAGRPVGRRAWRRRRAPGLRAAQDLELVGECPALVLPRSLLLAFSCDHVGGRPRDEVLGRELCRERGQLAVGPRDGARQEPAFLAHVDRHLQCGAHLAAVAGEYVCGGDLHAAVEREPLHLR